MDNTSGSDTCAKVCWGVGAVVGLLVLIIAMRAWDWSFLLALIVGLLVFVAIGIWMRRAVCSSADSGSQATAAPAQKPAPAAAPSTPEPEPEAAPAPQEAAPAAQETAPAPAAQDPAPAAPQSTTAADPSVVKPSLLAGQTELSSRKGTWSYSAPGAAPVAPASGGDGPETLAGPRNGGADDLKLLKGVGPKLEQTLNELGFYHFDQIAAWTDEQVAWVDDKLKFKGRIARDGWIEQAKILAAGGETEFSKRNT